ncbi:MAG TPA: SRPBCC family protein [Terriglobales bacterium]|nr:SRPBCC family protein [Terriglobales bacterium]
MNRHMHGGSTRNRKMLSRWGALLGGGALAAYGISRRSKPGAALAAAGGLLVYGGSRLNSRPGKIHAESSFTINVPPEEAYRFWLDLENLPRFMSHLQSVRKIDDRRSEWIARGPMQLRIKWTAEIVDRRENEWIVWRSDPNMAFHNSGSVQFRRAPGNRGTEVTVALQYDVPAGPVGKSFAMMFGKNPSQAVYEDLRHFKQLMEAGEIATTVGQPHGRRSKIVRLGHALYPDIRPRPVQTAQGRETLQEARVS